MREREGERESERENVCMYVKKRGYYKGSQKNKLSFLPFPPFCTHRFSNKNKRKVRSNLMRTDCSYIFYSSGIKAEGGPSHSHNSRFHIRFRSNDKDEMSEKKTEREEGRGERR